MANSRIIKKKSLKNCQLLKKEIHFDGADTHILKILCPICHIVRKYITGLENERSQGTALWALLCNVGNKIAGGASHNSNRSDESE